jgi:hypothetical protein
MECGEKREISTNIKFNIDETDSMMSTPKDWKACPSDRARAANEMRNGFERLCDCSARHAEKFFWTDDR